MYLYNLKELLTYIDTLEIINSECLMIFAADGTFNEIETLISNLNERKITFFGGIFPRLLIGTKEVNTGFIVEKLSPRYCGIVLPHMFRIDLKELSLDSGTVIVLADGLTSIMGDLITTLNEKLGNNFNFIGGGAGFYDLIQKKCIFDNNGLYQDMMYICILENKTYSAVEHGWLPIDGPFYVKKSIDNKIMQLDQHNAFEIYKHIVEEEENITLSKEDFFAFAKDHPFGILQKDGTFIVRDPIALDDEENIICVANIPEGCDVFILKGDKKTLLDSSLSVSKKCFNNQPARYIPLIVDCISRKMFLEDVFTEELKNIQKHIKNVLQGILSIGEFSSDQKGEFSIHNKSIVVAMIEY